MLFGMIFCSKQNILLNIIISNQKEIHLQKYEFGTKFQGLLLQSNNTGQWYCISNSQEDNTDKASTR